MRVTAPVKFVYRETSETGPYRTARNSYMVETGPRLDCLELQRSGPSSREDGGHGGHGGRKSKPAPAPAIRPQLQ